MLVFKFKKTLKLFRSLIFWLTTTTRAIYCKFSQSQLRTDPLCSLKSFRDTITMDLVLETLRDCLRQSSLNRQREETCESINLSNIVDDDIKAYTMIYINLIT